MNLGRLIKNQRSDFDMTLRELEEKIDMPHPQISRYETGKTNLKDKTAVEILVKGFDIPYSKAKDMVAEFKMKEASKELSEESREEIMRGFNKEIFGVEDPSFLDDDKNWIPVYANIADGYTKTPPKPIDEYPIPRTFKQYSQDQLFYAVATDDSMSPTINQNDEILILREDFDLEDGKLYVFKENKAYIVRKYEKITEDIAQLVSENQSYPKITLTNKNEFQCMGQVIRIQKLTQ